MTATAEKSSQPAGDGKAGVQGKYHDLLQALSRLASNRQSDGTSSLVSCEDRGAIINGCYDLMIDARSHDRLGAANAHLIAAADLRDALATLLELHDALGAGQSYAATKARAALAKASRP